MKRLSIIQLLPQVITGAKLASQFEKDLKFWL